MNDEIENNPDAAQAVEEKNQAGTAPRRPTDPTVERAHAAHEVRRERAEDIQADMEKHQADGATPQEAKMAAQLRNGGRSPEDRSATVPENRER